MKKMKLNEQQKVAIYTEIAAEVMEVQGEPRTKAETHKFLLAVTDITNNVIAELENQD